MTITLYGIPNCDTVKKARTWLDAKGLAYTFHDYKKQGANTSVIKRPIVEHPGGLLVGFKEAEWAADLG